MVTAPVELSDPLGLPRPGESWWVLYTRSRHEKRVEFSCLRLGVRHYLPLRRGRSVSAGGVRAQVPLFPGYVFACASQSDYLSLLRMGGIAKPLAVRRPEILVRELREIRAALEAGGDLLSTPALERGRWVRLSGGPLRGVEGVVHDRRVRRGRLHLVLNVSLLGQGAMVEIDAADVEPLGGWRDGTRRLRVGAGVRTSCRGAVSHIAGAE